MASSCCSRLDASRGNSGSFRHEAMKTNVNDSRFASLSAPFAQAQLSNLDQVQHPGA